MADRSLQAEREAELLFDVVAELLFAVAAELLSA